MRDYIKINTLCDIAYDDGNFVINIHERATHNTRRMCKFKPPNISQMSLLNRQINIPTASTEAISIEYLSRESSRL